MTTAQLRAHWHVLVAALVGCAAGALATFLGWASARPVTHILIGWSVGAWTYLALTAWTMAHSDRGNLIRVAKAQAESAGTVLAIVVAAALASLGAVVVELAAAKHAGLSGAWAHVLITVVTVVGSWLLVPALFALIYASRYHGIAPTGGLDFQDASRNFEPDYSDFLYFAFTIAVASQTADVAITGRPMRRLALVQSLLSFVFNTAILAFAINLAASLV